MAQFLLFFPPFYCDPLSVWDAHSINSGSLSLFDGSVIVFFYCCLETFLSCILAVSSSAPRTAVPTFITLALTVLSTLSYFTELHFFSLAFFESFYLFVFFSSTIWCGIRRDMYQFSEMQAIFVVYRSVPFKSSSNGFA